METGKFLIKHFTIPSSSFGKLMTHDFPCYALDKSINNILGLTFFQDSGSVVASHFLKKTLHKAEFDEFAARHHFEINIFSRSLVTSSKVLTCLMAATHTARCCEKAPNPKRSAEMACRMLSRMNYIPSLYVNIDICTWNPNDPWFDWKRPCFGGLTFKNTGQLGSRYIQYIHICMYIDIDIRCVFVCVDYVHCIYQIFKT